MQYNAATSNVQVLLTVTISLLNDARAKLSSTDAEPTVLSAANALHLLGLVVRAAAQQGYDATQTAALFEVPESLPVPSVLVQQGEGRLWHDDEEITRAILPCAKHALTKADQLSRFSKSLCVVTGRVTHHAEPLDMPLCMFCVCPGHSQLMKVLVRRVVALVIQTPVRYAVQQGDAA